MTNGESSLNIAHSTMGAGCLGMHSAIVMAISGDEKAAPANWDGG